MPTADGGSPPLADGVRRFPCPRCGADVAWHPGAARLRCDYCGYVREVGRDPDGADAIAEVPLAAGLAEPTERGWGTERRSWRCASCGAVETLEPGVKAGACAFCGTPGVIEAPPDAGLVRPHGVLPFRIPRERATGNFRSWLASLWFRPGDLARHAELDRVRGVYVPFWTFDADTTSRWSAESGRTVGSGKQARTVWTRVSGTLEHRFDDLPVPASRGLDADLARRIEPFPTAELVAYDPAYLAGFVAEEHGVPLAEAWGAAKARMEATLRSACRAEVPGAHCRNLTVDTTWSGVGWKACLLPVWIAAYRYRNRPFRFVVNGATGAAAGTAPWSWWKIGFACAALALALLWLIAR